MIKYPRVRFLRNSNGKLTKHVLVVVELNEKEETTDWFSLGELKTIFENQREEERK